MSNLFYLLIVIPFSVFAQKTPTVVQEVFNLYQNEAYNLYRQDFYLHVDQDNSAPNGHAVFTGNGLEIGLNSASLKIYKGDLILATVCHEMGHFLGKQFEGYKYSIGLAPEGEADYFSGKCMVHYFTEVRNLSIQSAQSTATSLAKKRFGILKHANVNAAVALLQRYAKGIQTEHPNFECRLLSVMYGANGKARPQCWFNPK